MPNTDKERHWTALALSIIFWLAIIAAIIGIIISVI